MNIHVDSQKITQGLLVLIALTCFVIVLCLAGVLGAEEEAESEGVSDEQSQQQAEGGQAASGSGGSAANQTEGVQASSAEQSSGSAQPAEYANIDQSALQGLLGKTVSKNLISKAKTNEDAAWIAAHYKEYEQYGKDQQVKLLTLASKESQALPFVRNYRESDESATGTCDALQKGKVPELYQWDTRWAWVKYSEHCIGTSGCGVTALAMVYQGLTGDSSKSPYDLSVDSVKNNYVHSGTDPDFYAFEAKHLGLKCEEVSPSVSNLKKALGKGSIVIINVGPGDFTTGGHYIVGYAIDGLGKLHVRDPYSAVNTAKSWDVSSVMGQAKRLFVFSE